VASMASSAVVLVLVMGYLWAVHARPARVTDLVGLVTPRRGGLRRALRPVLVGAFCYVAVGVGVGLLAGELGVSADDIPAQPLSALIAAEESGPLVVLAYVMAAVAAPVTEEVMFRAVLYLPLRRRLGRWTAAVLVGVVFAAMHDYAWGAPQFFVLSLTFVAVFEATGTLWAPIVVHGCFNGLSVAIMRALDLLG